MRGSLQIARLAGIPIRLHVTFLLTLLPIGGISRLERMPEIPARELLVATEGRAAGVSSEVLLLRGLESDGPGTSWRTS